MSTNPGADERSGGADERCDHGGGQASGPPPLMVEAIRGRPEVLTITARAAGAPRESQ